MAHNVVLLDTLPAGMRLMEWTVLGTNGACTYEVATRQVGCDLGELAPWTNPDPDVPQVLVELLVAVDADATPGLVTNTVVVQANNDLDPTYAYATDDNRGERRAERREDGVDAGAGER